MYKGAVDHKGVTLLELMIVLAVIGIAASMAIPSYVKMLPHMRIKAAARDISGVLNYARMNAIARNQTVTVTFTVSTTNLNDSYYLDDHHRSAGLDWVGKVDMWWGSGAGAKYNAAPKFANSDGAGKVEFNPMGRADDQDENEQAIYLKGKDFTAGDEEYRVRLTSLTGKVTVEHWNGVDAWVK